MFSILFVTWKGFICIGRHMMLTRVICDKSGKVDFWKVSEPYEPVGRVQFVVFKLRNHIPTQKNKKRKKRWYHRNIKYFGNILNSISIDCFELWGKQKFKQLTLSRVLRHVSVRLPVHLSSALWIPLFILFFRLYNSTETNW